MWPGQGAHSQPPELPADQAKQFLSVGRYIRRYILPAVNGSITFVYTLQGQKKNFFSECDDIENGISTMKRKYIYDCY